MESEEHQSSVGSQATSESAVAAPQSASVSFSDQMLKAFTDMQQTMLQLSQQLGSRSEATGHCSTVKCSTASPVSATKARPAATVTSETMHMHEPVLSLQDSDHSADSAVSDSESEGEQDAPAKRRRVAKHTDHELRRRNTPAPKRDPPPHQSAPQMDGSDGSDSDEAMWSQVDKAMPVLEEKLAPPINHKLAKRLGAMWDTTVPYSKKKDMHEQYHTRPQNLPYMVVPKLHSEINQKLSKADRKADERLVNCQRSLTCAAVAIAQAAEHLVDARHHDTPPDSRKVVTDLVQASAMIGQTHCMLSDKRRQQLRHALSREYRGICMKAIPTGEYLLGEDWQKEFKEAKESAKSVREAFYQGPSQGHREAGPFLGLSHRGRLPFSHQYHSGGNNHAAKQHRPGKGKYRALKNRRPYQFQPRQHQGNK